MSEKERTKAEMIREPNPDAELAILIQQFMPKSGAVSGQANALNVMAQEANGLATVIFQKMMALMNGKNKKIKELEAKVHELEQTVLKLTPKKK